LVQHVAKNFKKEEILEISSKALNLSEKFDKRTYEREIKNFLKNKTHKQLNKIKFVHGHAIPYGIHKYFKKEARYITFIRNPVRRIPSIYNYFYTLFERKKDKELEKRLNRVFLVKDEIPEFETWYNAKFRRKSKDIAFMSTYHLLSELGYIKKTDKTASQIQKSLNKFYFIGITKNFKTDSLFLYQKFGINKYFLSENVSKRYIDYQKNQKLLKLISKDNPISMEIFYAAIRFNQDFINKNPDFLKIVRKERIKRTLFLPFTQAIFEPGRLLQLFRK